MNYRGFGKSFWQNKVTPTPHKYIFKKTGKIHPKNKISQKIEFIFSFQLNIIKC